LSLQEREEKMSSSKGRIFIGKSGLLVDEVEFLQKDKELNLWDEEIERKFLEIEREFLKKIKDKATEEARRILKEAQEESISIKKNAYEEGYTEGYRDGRQKAEKEVEKKFLKLKEEMSARFLNILEGIEKQKRNIYNRFREDILNLILVSVEKITTIAISKNKKQILSNMLEESLREIEEAKKIKITVSKEDVEIVQTLLESIKDRFPGIGNWELKETDSLKEGELVLDIGTTRVENYLENRKEMVFKILENVSLEQEGE